MGEQALVPFGCQGSMPRAADERALVCLGQSCFSTPQAGFNVCHCIEEFYLRRILPLGCRDKYAYECPRMANPSYEPSTF
jgi:hypothetical protein